MRAARPNDAHRALAALEAQGRVAQLVTQNVDGLHQAAGSRNVIDLHGRVDVVRCLSCERRLPREQVQAELVERNPRFAALDAVEAPDGDAALDGVDFAAFDVPALRRLRRAAEARRRVLRRARAGGTRASARSRRSSRPTRMLVVGSSLMVYSGYRFARAMADAGKPIAAVNLGRTRADELLALKVTERCADALAFLLLQRRPQDARGAIA